MYCMHYNHHQQAVSFVLAFNLGLPEESCLFIEEL